MPAWSAIFEYLVLYTPVIYAPRYRRLGILYQNQTLLLRTSAAVTAF